MIEGQTLRLVLSIFRLPRTVALQARAALAAARRAVVLGLLGAALRRHVERTLQWALIIIIRKYRHLRTGHVACVPGIVVGASSVVTARLRQVLDLALVRCGKIECIHVDFPIRTGLQLLEHFVRLNSVVKAAG